MTLEDVRTEVLGCNLFLFEKVYSAIAPLFGRTPIGQGQDVLLFVDNIFRFVQAGSEVSALLGRMPSAVGYQPTLGTDVGALQERFTSAKNGSITSVQAVYVPADEASERALRTLASLKPSGAAKTLQTE